MSGRERVVSAPHRAYKYAVSPLLHGCGRSDRRMPVSTDVFGVRGYRGSDMAWCVAAGWLCCVCCAASRCAGADLNRSSRIRVDTIWALNPPHCSGALYHRN